MSFLYILGIKPLLVAPLTNIFSQPKCMVVLPQHFYCARKEFLGGWGLTGKEGFPGGTTGKEPACQCRRHMTLRFDPWIGKIPWRGGRQPTPVLLPRESHGQRSLVGHSPRGHKELDTTEGT